MWHRPIQPWTRPFKPELDLQPWTRPGLIDSKQQAMTTQSNASCENSNLFGPSCLEILYKGSNWFAALGSGEHQYLLQYVFE